jgi:hypothetical protein
MLLWAYWAFFWFTLLSAFGGPQTTRGLVYSWIVAAGIPLALTVAMLLALLRKGQLSSLMIIAAWLLAIVPIATAD